MNKRILIVFFVFTLSLSSLAFATEIDIKIEYPPDKTKIILPSDHVIIQGKAFAKGANIPLIDLFIVIDSSGSTGRPSGVDVNGNGIIGRRTEEMIVFGIMIGSKITDPGDSVLAAEVQAAKNLLRQLDPKTTRVGVVNFSGDFLPGTGYDGSRTFMVNPATPDAFLVQPLTSDFSRVNRALDRVYLDGAYGGTNISEGIRISITELTGAKNSISNYRTDTKKIIVLLSDGVPTFPVGSASISDPEDKSLAISAARIAKVADIKIHTFALGMESFQDPYTLQEIARESRGVYTPVPNPGDIITVLPKTSFVELDYINIINETITERAKNIMLNPAGDFLASVPVKNGENRILAEARASDGSRAKSMITLYFEKRDSIENLKDLTLMKKPDLSLDLGRKEQENLLLELEKAHKKALMLELERARKRNKKLDEEMAEQRKKLSEQKKENDKTEEKSEKLELELKIKDTK